MASTNQSPEYQKAQGRFLAASTDEERIRALEELHLAGIRTFVMVAPMLPRAEELVAVLEGKVDYVLIDRMNYHYADWVYRKYKLGGSLSDDRFSQTSKELCSKFEKQGINCRRVASK